MSDMNIMAGTGVAVREYKLTTGEAGYGLSRKHMTSGARTTAGQTGISGGDVKEMPIPLCPAIEQSRIVELAKQQLEAVVRADDLLVADESRSLRLRQSILKSAFEGTLTEAKN